jgi:hypothetical protein
MKSEQLSIAILAGLWAAAPSSLPISVIIRFWSFSVFAPVESPARMITVLPAILTCAKWRAPRYDHLMTTIDTSPLVATSD